MKTIVWSSILVSIALIFLAYHPEIITGRGAVGNPIFGISDAGTAQNGAVDATAIIGALFVFGFYIFKFGRWSGPEASPPGFRPKPTRHFTTWLHYVLWAVLYGTVMVIFYFLIIFFPKFFFNILDLYLNFQISQGQGGALGNLNSGFRVDVNNIVPYAIIFVTLIWSTVFVKWERAFRNTLQEYALIPTEATRIIEFYEKTPTSFKPDPDEIPRVQKAIVFDLISKKDFEAGSSDWINKYAICEYLVYRITRLKTQRYFSRIISRYQEDFDEILMSLTRLRSKLQNYKSELLDSLRQLNVTVDEPFSTPLSEIEEKWQGSKKTMHYERRYFEGVQESLKKSVDDYLHSTLQIIVCSVLAIGRSPYQRIVLLKKFGLKENENLGTTLNKEHIIRASLMLALVLVVSTGAFHFSSLVSASVVNGSSQQLLSRIPVPSKMSDIVLWTFSATIMHMLGIIAGYSTQKWLNYERKQFDNSAQETIYVSDYFTCFSFGFSLNIFLFMFLLLMTGKWSGFETHWFWAFVPGVSAAFTGYYMSNSSSPPIEPGKKSYRHMLLQGELTVLAGIAVMWFIYENQLMRLPEIPRLNSFMIYLFITLFAIGFVLSYFLQSVFWRTQTAKKDIPDEKQPQSPG
jgi:hypothetical protein